MKQIITACCALLLSSCSAFFPSSSFSSDHVSSSNEPSSTSSSRREEQDATLRRLWLQFERNNARIYSEAGLLGAYLGEAVYFSEEEGWATIEPHGVFSFTRNESIAPGDFIAEGRLSSYRGPAPLSRLGPGAFIREGEEFKIRSFDEPFLSEWFLLVNEKRPLSALDDFRMKVEDKRVDIVMKFRNGEEDTRLEEVTYRLENIGDVHCQETENFLAYPPELSPRDSFDHEILDYFERRLGSKEAIPFPKDVPVTFSDRYSEKGIDCFAIGSSFWSSYPAQVEKAGFSKTKEGGWSKLFRTKDGVQKAIVHGTSSPSKETLSIHVAMEPIECVGFAFINERLNHSPFPPFPPGLSVDKTWIVQEEERILEIEIGFKTLEGAVEYFEGSYLPLLKERGFRPEENQTQSSWRWAYENENGEVAISRGGSFGESEVSYRVFFERTPLI